MKNFSYTGATQTFTAPYAGYYKVELWGASGRTDGHTLGPGRGGYVSGYLKLNTNAVLYAYIGEVGALTEENKAQNTFNGGGYNHGSNQHYGRGGGGTDFRTLNGTWSEINSLRSRIIVAGGGGSGNSGSTTDVYGGHAGGLTSYLGVNNHTVGYKLATQTDGYQFGIGGPGLNGQGYSGSGGGWYGGQSGTIPTTDNKCDSTTGGSSYISGHTGSVAVTSTTDSSPKSGCTTGTTNNACSISPYGYTFTNTVMIDGAGYSWTNTKGALQQMPNPSGGYYASGVGHSGNGYARITYLGTSI